MKHPGKTPPFRGPFGEPVAGCIAEMQVSPAWRRRSVVMIQNDNVSNPPLILLHGGPGMSEASFLRHCNAALEKSFTVVYWDRGAAVVPR